MPYALFSDFDGTLTDRDTIDLLVEQHIGAEYKRSVSSRLLKGEMTIRQALTEEFSLLQLPPEEIREFLVAHVKLDPALPELIEYTRRHEIPFTILSSGMDLLILPLLEACGCEAAVHCNRLVWSEHHAHREPVVPLGDAARSALGIKEPGADASRAPNEVAPGSFAIEFLDESEFGHDKAAELMAAREEGYTTIYMGDGLSDTPCADVADVLFARRQLERYCRERGIPYRPLVGAADVLAFLRENEPAER
jgi:HAD superfamily phosphoserine phosphatase-like hydrolase